MNNILETLANLSILVFVVCSMLAMGLSYTFLQMVEPLKNWGMVIKIILANFIIVPVVAFLTMMVIPLDEPYRIGLLLIAFSAGAPFIPKLVQIARANVAFSVGLMALIMILTIIIVPIVLPFLMPDISVSAWDIAKSLVLLMLIPLVIGGIIKARYESAAKKIVPVFNSASNLSLIALIVLMLILNWDYLISVIGTGAIVSIIILVLAAIISGYLLGGKDKKNKQVLALGTGQRNLSAAMVIAVQNFEDPVVMTMVIVAGVVGVVILFIAAGEFGRRNKILNIKIKK